MPAVHVPQRVGAVLGVARNASLRRVLLAFAGFSITEWMTWIAILVFAYARGGATETGIAAVVQLVPSALVAPVAAVLGDHVRRERALLIAYLAQTVAMAMTAVALFAGSPGWVVYAFAALAATSITLTRPVQGAILPSLSRAPSELTAANVAVGLVENGSLLIGPLLAGVLLVLVGPGTVFAAAAALTGGGALLVAGIRPLDVDEWVAERSRDGAGGLLSEALGGFRTLAREPRPRAVLLLMTGAAVLWGALDVYLVVLAFDRLALGEAGVGYLNAALGLGGLVGAVITVGLIGRSALGGPLAIGLALWAIALAALGLVPVVAVAFALLAGAGVGSVLIDVSGRTLLQRVAPGALLSRVFGVLEGVSAAGLAVGSALAPLLIALLGIVGALLASGVGLLALVAVSWRVLRDLDTVPVARPRELAILRSTTLFAPLSPPALERLAGNLRPVHAHAGTVVIRQGEAGDHFYILTDGEVSVAVDGREVRRLAAGSSFGEIALLRNVPRTATVRALTGAELLALERHVFLEAVTGHAASSAAAERLVDEQLGQVAPVDTAEEGTHAGP
ncbi:MAG TPA: MFS transporter [Candidatus Limnocylindria bacterium]|nr:MFS transporter [Candidatus Limnocylindria bacterium]